MDTNYLEIITIIQNTETKIKEIITKVTKESFEDKKGYSSVQNFLSEIEIVTDTLEYYSRPIKEGYLIKNSNGQFEIKCINNGGRYPLYCGNHIEILINTEGWKTGIVKSTNICNKGYYFYNEELKHPALYTGMKTRIRVID